MSIVSTKKIEKEVELTVEKDTPAKVTKRTKDGVVTYEAKVSEKEIDPNENEDSELNNDGEDDSYDDENSLPFIDESPAQEIRKTKLESMFALVRSAVKDDKKEDIFYAFVVRQPDNIDARYYVPCGRETELGIFQFSSRDMFKFPAEIQKRNGNSGGIFNVSVYDSNQNPLILYRRQRNRMFTSEIVVGMQNYSVMNPVRDEIGNNGGNGNVNLESQIMTLIERQDERFQRFIEQSNLPKEKSLFEKAFEQKILQEITNPPERHDSMQDMQKVMMQSFAGMLAMPEMVRGFASSMFPQPTPPEQKDWLDKIGQALELPVVQNVLLKAGDIAEAVAISRLPPVQNPADEHETEPEADDKNDMQLLLETVIEELESERPLDATNEVIQSLRSDYPSQFDDLQTTCQTFAFDGVFGLLVNKASKMQPPPFAPFLDIAETQKTSKYVWNERGEKLKVRLEEFYEFVKIA